MLKHIIRAIGFASPAAGAKPQGGRGKKAGCAARRPMFEGMEQRLAMAVTTAALPEILDDLNPVNPEAVEMPLNGEREGDSQPEQQAQQQQAESGTALGAGAGDAGDTAGAPTITTGEGGVATLAASAAHAAPKYFDGIVVGSDVKPAVAIPLIRRLGFSAVRLWAGFDNWNGKWIPREIGYAKQYKAAGFKVMVMFNNPKVPTYQQAKNWFTRIVNQPGVKGAIDRWEIGNEVNLRGYWKGTIKQYVNQLERAAWDVLAPRGETVVGASISFSLDKMKQMVDAGYLKYCHIGSFHNYAGSAASQIGSFAKVKAMFNGKPLSITEWQLRPGNLGDKANWSRELAKARPWIEANTESAFYYRITYKAKAWGGQAAVYDAKLKPYQPFYNLFMEWKK